MGIVNIEDDLHEQLRRASKVSLRSINAQAAFWIKIGLLCETNPTLSFTQIMERELVSAGVSTQSLGTQSLGTQPLTTPPLTTHARVANDS